MLSHRLPCAFLNCPTGPADECSQHLHLKRACLQVDKVALTLARANGETMYSMPLERIAGLVHPAPNLLKIKVEGRQQTL